MCDVTNDEKQFLDFVSMNDAGWNTQNVANMGSNAEFDDLGGLFVGYCNRSKSDR